MNRIYNFENFINSINERLAFHGTNDNYDSFLLTNDGNDQFGTGAYFTFDNSVAKHYGNNILTIDTDDIRVIDYNDPISDELVEDLLYSSTSDWWMDWSENKESSIDMFKSTLDGSFGLDIQSLWYDLYLNDEMNFVKIVSKYVDAMNINEENSGFDNGLLIVYSLDKIKKG